MKVIEGLELVVKTNVDHAQLREHVAASIRRQLPQVHPIQPRSEIVCLVGGGPSLEATLHELRDLIFDGALLVTTNGAYKWCIEHNLRPTAQIILDARPENAAFLEPAIKNCRYFLASQCHPSLFDAVEGRPMAAIYHAIGDETGELEKILDAFYLGRYHLVAGGSTVVMRSVSLLRTLGYFRFHLFGADSCWLDDQHHAYDQPLNGAEKRLVLKLHPGRHPELERAFHVAPWHIKQLEDFLHLVAEAGDQFLINVHGPGLLAYALEAGAQADDIEVAVAEDGVTSGT